MIDENIAATARLTQHAVAVGHGEWVNSAPHTACLPTTRRLWLPPVPGALLLATTDADPAFIRRR
jgi:hypothetical protein